MASDKFDELFPEQPGYVPAKVSGDPGTLAYARKKKSQERRTAFIEAFIQNWPEMTIEQICEMIGVTRRAYEVWRKKHPDFTIEIDRLKAEIREGSPVGEEPAWTSTFADFRLRYFGFESYVYHRKIAEVLDNAPEGSISLILLPPGAGKTTCLEDWMCQKLALDPDHRILFLSESQNEATKRLRTVQQRMSDPALAREFIARFGPFYTEGQDKKGKPWTANHFTVSKRASGERDYSLAALGMSSQIYGIRADTIIMDDVQTLKSLNQTDSYLLKFRQEILSRRPAGGARGRVVIIATRIATGDFYERLIEEELIDEGQLVVLPCTIRNEDGEEVPYCPEMFPPEQVARIKKQAGDSWWTAYQQTPHLSHNATFTDEMLADAKDPLRKVGEVRPGEHVVVGVDPALQGATGIVTLAYTSNSIAVVDVLQMEQPRSQEVIIDAIRDTVARYRPLDVVVETMAYQQALYNDDRFKALATQYGFRPRSHKTYGNKADAAFGVSGIVRSFQMRELHIPDADEASKARVEPLVSELRVWRPDVKTKFLQQDTVMALWFAWKHIVEHGRRNPGPEAAEQFKTRGLRRPTVYRGAA